MYLRKFPSPASMAGRAGMESRRRPRQCFMATHFSTPNISRMVEAQSGTFSPPFECAVGYVVSAHRHTHIFLPLYQLTYSLASVQWCFNTI